MKMTHKLITLLGVGISSLALSGCYDIDYIDTPPPPASVPHYGPPAPESNGEPYYGAPPAQPVVAPNNSGPYYGPPPAQPPVSAAPNSSAPYYGPPPAQQSNSAPHYGPATQVAPAAAPTPGVIPVVRTAEMKKEITPEPVTVTKSDQASTLPDAR